MLIVLCGQAGSGKDTVADMLCELDDSMVKVSLADPLKRFCMEVFNFTEGQLWGPSEQRDMPDVRYPLDGSTLPLEIFGLESQLKHLQDLAAEGPCEPIDTAQMRSIADMYLTPRKALQLLGTEWGRACYPHTWIVYALRIIRQLQEGNYNYSKRQGVIYDPTEGPKSVVIPDGRFGNELKTFRNVGAYNVKITGRTSSKIKTTEHRSETEQKTLSEDAFDFIINNNGTYTDLCSKVKGTYLAIKSLSENT